MSVGKIIDKPLIIYITSSDKPTCWKVLDQLASHWLRDWSGNTPESIMKHRELKGIHDDFYIDTQFYFNRTRDVHTQLEYILWGFAKLVSC